MAGTAAAPRPAAPPSGTRPAVVHPATGPLELVGLRKRFGDVQALDGCSVTVRAGRVLGLLGPNGAGKTTAMRCIFGLAEADAGRVCWAGAPVDEGVRMRFGYMPEERGLYPHMRVRAQLEYLARLSGLDGRAARDGAERWLTRLGLRDRAEDRLDALSHGNQQRVQLAAALVHDPLLVVLDEPFAGLDPIAVDALSAIIAELAADGMAILFSSHQLDLVEDVCEDVVVVDRGRTVMAGALQRLRDGSGTRVLSVGFRGDRCWTPSLARGRVLSAQPGATRLELEGEADLDRVVALARAAGEVTRLSLEPPTLSDLFRRAVGR